MAVQYPVIGQWFRRPNGTLFEVVAIDEDDMTVEIQLFDGTIDEIDIERWPELLLTEVAAPEDWSGSVDMDPEDYTGSKGHRDAERLSRPAGVPGQAVNEPCGSPPCGGLWEAACRRLWEAACRRLSPARRAPTAADSYMEVGPVT